MENKTLSPYAWFMDKYPYEENKHLYDIVLEAVEDAPAIVYPTWTDEDIYHYLEYRTRWIPVEEGLPEDKTNMVCYNAGIRESSYCGLFRQSNPLQIYFTPNYKTRIRDENTNRRKNKKMVYKKRNVYLA
jgi:hypothetical protein